MKRITINASTEYDVLVGPDLLKNIGTVLSEAGFAPGRMALITDSTVDELYGEQVCAELKNDGYEVYRCVFPAGEGYKTWTTLGYILDYLAAAEIRRSDFILGLGGGVVGDLAGFAASVYLRGVPLVLAPTTLLAAVDSSVGGKNGVNLGTGKNMAGSFYQPRLVVCDTTVLSRLNAAQFAEGVAEIIKCGMIADEKLLARIVDFRRSRATGFVPVISACLRIKGDLVARDEFDRGDRHLLNFGHTPAHAIERCSGYRISHGQAVAMGMSIMTRAAIAKGLADSECALALHTALLAHGMAQRCPYGAAELAALARMDKKRQGDIVRLVIPEIPGRCRVYPIEVGELYSWLAAGLGEA
ncbi:MAG: 3-dehydroquinate synthase [Syntrophomonadaceae bacterium]|nr:3-dehydroquinate synthase [Syntrophomonadaceae bacterium]